jgi:hypothetical protein
MAAAVFPAPSAGGGIKLVQRGVAASAGNITITAIDTTKAFVTFVSQGAAGTVATNSSSTGTLSPSNGQIVNGYGNNNVGHQDIGGFPTFSGTRTLSGGTMDATTKQMGVYLSNSTTLVATGACRWEVVEFA